MADKRERESKDAAFRSTKRQRIESHDNIARTSKGRLTGAIVNVDDLDWKPVTLPDRFEDAEGFFGLEEIEGVDVVKPRGNGRVKFKTAKSRSNESILKKLHGRLGSKWSDVDAAAVDGADEWDGFDDDASPEADAALDGGPLEDIKGKKKGRGRKGEGDKCQKQKTEDQLLSKNKRAALKRDGGIQTGGTFALLQEQDAEEDVDVSAWEPLNLSPELQTSLSKLKFAKPTPIQMACIPEIMAGHDVIGKAPTGSGKTLAFGIPILENYLKTYRTTPRYSSNDIGPRENDPIALIVSPTRELAHQLSKHLTALSSNAPNVSSRTALLTGGLSIEKQQRLLTNADIIIGTPGRLWEVISDGRGLIRKLKNIRFLVIDEADRLLSEGHYRELEGILNALDRADDDYPGQDANSSRDSKNEDSQTQRQTLVFSATFHKGLQQRLAGKGRFPNNNLLDKKESMEYLLKKVNFRELKVKFIDVNPVSQMAENLKEGLIECDAMEKDLYLYTLLLYYPKHRSLVFTNSISAVRRLTSFLQNLNLPALALHSSMSQKARLRSVERFSSQPSDPSSILVATDVAARGLDIKGIDLIIHYHVPRTADAYIHRSGRTARGSASGKSILICAPDEMVGVVRLAAKVHSSNPPTPHGRFPLGSIDLDRRIIARLRPRVALSKRITDCALAKEKLSSEDNWLRSAAEDLGVDYDSEEFAEQETQGKGKGRGRGGGRRTREKLASRLSKVELAGLRAQLSELLAKRVNVAVSEKRFTVGRVDVDALLRGNGNELFLGQVDPLAF